MNRGLIATGVTMWAGALVCAPICAAEPVTPADPVAGAATEPAPAPPLSAPQSASPAQELAKPVQPGNPVLDSCRLFNAALNVAAANYEDFAYATAGNGNYVDYQDAMVGRTNVVGRTALRQAAAAALSASHTAGLPPEVSDPMRSWSLHATKLVLVMGLHGGGDTLNNSVVELNTIGHEAQMACAASGFRG